MEYIDCPLCGSRKSELLFRRSDLTYHISDVWFSVVRCRGCGLVYVNPRPSEQEIHEYYTDEFYDADAEPDRLLADKEAQLRVKYEYLKDLVPGRLLDVGCAKGEFMKFMQLKGWDVSGVDFSTKPPNVFGLRIHHGDLVSAGISEESVDLVTMWAVLEHVYGPKEMLGTIARLLKPGGSIVLAVPNFLSLPGRIMRQDDVPRHTTLFTKRTLSRVLCTAGFKVDRIRCDHRLYGGTNRGIFNFLYKLLAGEKIEDVVAQSRNAAQWHQYSSQIRGIDSKRMLWIDSKDIEYTPKLDRWLDKLGFGFTMVVRATKKA